MARPMRLYRDSLGMTLAFPTLADRKDLARDNLRGALPAEPAFTGTIDLKGTDPDGYLVALAHPKGPPPEM